MFETILSVSNQKLQKIVFVFSTILWWSSLYSICTSYREYQSYCLTYVLNNNLQILQKLHISLILLLSNNITWFHRFVSKICSLFTFWLTTMAILISMCLTSSSTPNHYIIPSFDPIDQHKIIYHLIISILRTKRNA